MQWLVLKDLVVRFRQNTSILVPIYFLKPFIHRVWGRIQEKMGRVSEMIGKNFIYLTGDIRNG
jgi:hypothetical protein